MRPESQLVTSANSEEIIASMNEEECAKKKLSEDHKQNINQAIRQSLANIAKSLGYGVKADCDLEKSIATLTKKICVRYIDNFTRSDFHFARCQSEQIELRSQFKALLTAINNYPLDNAKSEFIKAISSQLNVISKKVAEIDDKGDLNRKRAKTQGQLTILRFKAQMQTFPTDVSAQQSVPVTVSGGEKQQYPHWDSVKDYAKKALEAYKTGWFIADDRKVIVDILLGDENVKQSILYRNVPGNSYTAGGEVNNKKFNSTESYSLRKVLDRVLFAQKQIIEQDDKIDKSRGLFSFRNTTSSRLMDTLNDIASFIVTEQLKMGDATTQVTDDSLTQNLNAMITVAISRQKGLKVKGKLPNDYPSISMLNKNSVATNELIELRGQLLQNIDFLTKKYERIMMGGGTYFDRDVKAYVNLLKPMVTQLNTLLAQRGEFVLEDLQKASGDAASISGASVKPPSTQVAKKRAEGTASTQPASVADRQDSDSSRFSSKGSGDLGGSFDSDKSKDSKQLGKDVKKDDELKKPSAVAVGNNSQSSLSAAEAASSAGLFSPCANSSTLLRKEAEKNRKEDKGQNEEVEVRGSEEPTP